MRKVGQGSTPCLRPMLPCVHEVSDKLRFDTGNADAPDGSERDSGDEGDESDAEVRGDLHDPAMLADAASNIPDHICTANTSLHATSFESHATADGFETLLYEKRILVITTIGDADCKSLPQIERRLESRQHTPDEIKRLVPEPRYCLNHWVQNSR